jgi:hypothetical protein
MELTELIFSVYKKEPKKPQQRWPMAQLTRPLEGTTRAHEPLSSDPHA